MTSLEEITLIGYLIHKRSLDISCQKRIKLGTYVKLNEIYMKL